MVWPDKAIFMTWKQSSYARIRQILFSKVWGEWKCPQSKIEFKNDNNFSEKETRKYVFSKLKHRQKCNTISKRTSKMYKNWLILWLRPTSIIYDFDTTYFLLNYTSSSRAWRTIDIQETLHIKQNSKTYVYSMVQPQSRMQPTSTFHEQSPLTGVCVCNSF